MSTQSVSVPDLIKLVGGVTDTFVEEPVPVEVLVPPQPTTTSANPSRADGMTINGRFMSFSSLYEPSPTGATTPQGCVRIVDGYTMMQTDWQYPLGLPSGRTRGGVWECQIGSSR